MSEERYKSRAWIWWAAVLLFVMYPLSIGPAAWIVERAGSDRGEEIITILYHPLKLAYERSELISDAFDWYISLWVDFNSTTP